MKIVRLVIGGWMAVSAMAQQEALKPVEDVAGLPRVLLIGDSISVGYTLPVRELLKGKANVHRIPANGQTTRNTLAKLEGWLGTGKWDVINVNWGLHDLRLMEDGKHQVGIEEYEKNLRELVGRLKRTKAKLIYALTTPIPEAGLTPPRKAGDVVRYNEVAARVMKEAGVAIDDLYTDVLPRLGTLQRPANVHFTPEGSEYLAKKVAAAILGQLPPHIGFQWVNPLPANALAGLRHETYFSKLHNTKVGYVVYLPPGYEGSGRRYPVVYYLHGGRPGGEQKSVAMAKIFDKHIRSGAVAPMIYVFVNGGAVSHYDYPELGSWGKSALVKELIPHIDASYRTVASKQGRGLEGFSQGGRGTARIAFQHPELFCSAAPMGGGHQHEKYVAEHGGVEDGTDGYRFEAGNNTWDLAKPIGVRLLVAVGTKDFNYEANLEWMQHLTKKGVRYERVVVPDVPHNAAQVYEKIGPKAMQFHAACFAGK